MISEARFDFNAWARNSRVSGEKHAFVSGPQSMKMNCTPLCTKVLKDDFSRFAQRELNGDIQQRDKTGEFSPGAWKKCADMGGLGIPFPPEYGGSNLDIISTTAAMEGLGYGAEDRGLLFSINAQTWSIQMPILHFGTDEQKSRYSCGVD